MKTEARSFYVFFPRLNVQHLFPLNLWLSKKKKKKNPVFIPPLTALA